MSLNTHTNQPSADVLLWIHWENSLLRHSSWIQLLTTLLMHQDKTQKESTWQPGDPHINDMWMLLCRRPTTDSYSERPVLEQLQKTKLLSFRLGWLVSLLWWDGILVSELWGWPYTGHPINKETTHTTGPSACPGDNAKEMYQHKVKEFQEQTDPPGKCICNSSCLQEDQVCSSVYSQKNNQ